jgi:signal transduction histidine kinase
VIEAIWSLVGFGAGVGATALAARWQVRRSRARAQVAERRARAAERLAELGAMTGGLAHEIKNPLSTIGLNAQLLAEGIDELPTGSPVAGEDKQRLSRRLASLRREVERLRGILTDFLHYAGELRLEARPADLNAIVGELMDFFEPQATRQGVRLRPDLAPGTVPAMVDAALLKQAVLNLLLNGVQAMQGAAAPGPKELLVRTARAQDPDGRAMAVLHVIDTGPGIPPEVMPKIFTPYFTTKAGGSGLGLPTTRRLVEAHQGRLEVHSEVGKGTVFSVWLPAPE